MTNLEHGKRLVLVYNLTRDKYRTCQRSDIGIRLMPCEIRHTFCVRFVTFYLSCARSVTHKYLTFLMSDIRHTLFSSVWFVTHYKYLTFVMCEIRHMWFLIWIILRKDYKMRNKKIWSCCKKEIQQSSANYSYTTKNLILIYLCC